MTRYECNVLEGMTTILASRAVRSVMLEVSAPHLQQHGCSERRLLHMLRASGFDVPNERPAVFRHVTSWDLETAVL